MKSFTCDEVRAGISDFLAGESSRHDANLMDVHLAGCALCRGHAEKLVWQDRVIAELSAKARLDSMAGRVHAALGSLDQVEVGDFQAPRRRRWIAAAAAILVATVAAAVVFWPSSAPDFVVVPPKAKETRPAPAPENKAVVEPEPVAPLPDPYPKEPNVPPELPKTPVIVKETPEPALPKKPDVQIVAPEPPRTPEVARDANKPPAVPPKEHVIEIIKPKTVDDALNRGVAFLRSRSPKLEFTKGGGRESRPEELVLWTYFMAGLGEGDPEFQRLFKGVLERKLERTYDVALQAMLLEELDRVKYQWRLHQCAQFLADNQCRNGQWSYGDPSLFVDEIASAPLSAAAGGGKPVVREFPAASSPFAKDKPKVRRFVVITKRREGPESGDNSNSMYAALGLRACHDAGIVFPPDLLRTAEKAWREAFNGEGWCYGPRGHAHKPYGSMTAGGVGSLVILDYMQGRDWRKDPQVERGLAWLAKNFSVTEHPGPTEHNAGAGWMQYYYMYALERAGILYGTEKVGTHEWYKEGSQALLDVQRLDGAWVSKDGGSELNDTCFAILFLRRATRGLPPPLASGK